MNAPSIEVTSQTKKKVSLKSGANTCSGTFTCDIDILLFEIRATRVGDPRGIHIGDLLFSAENIQSGVSIPFTIKSEDITQGDGEYVISLWGKSKDGEVDFGNLNFRNLNFGDSGQWNQE